MSSNERGFSQVLVCILIVLLATIAVIVNQNLLNLEKVKKDTNDSTTSVMASTYDVTETTKIALGDKIYEITPNAEIKEDIYLVEEFIEFNKDFNVVTATLSTRYNNINYCILNKNKVVDYRLDPKTQFVGFNMGSVDTTSPSMSAVTIPNYDYPNTSSLVPYTASYSRNRLSFNTLNGVYSLKYPQIYKTSNSITEQSDMTTLAIALPTEFTDIIFIQSDLTHQAPIVLRDSSEEILDNLNYYPYIRFTYDESTNLITMTTNVTDIKDNTLNNTIVNSGITVTLYMHQNEAYDIASNTSVLNYPTQNKFKFQSNDTLELSNWNVSNKLYTMDFKGCIPRKITVTRHGYYHNISRKTSVQQLN